jgi:hypothetical protein
MQGRMSSKKLQFVFVWHFLERMDGMYVKINVCKDSARATDHRRQSSNKSIG